MAPTLECTEWPTLRFGDPESAVDRLVKAGCRTVQTRAEGYSEGDLLAVAMREKGVIGDAKLINQRQHCGGLGQRRRWRSPGPG